MSNVFYHDYRIEILPHAIPGGWSAKVQVWYFQAGTTCMTPLSLPTPPAFSTVEAVHAYAEKLGRQWIDRVLAEARRPPQKHYLPLTRQGAKKSKSQAPLATKP